MSATMPRLLARLAGWPRRIAALLCLLLAAASAALPSTHASSAPPSSVGRTLRPGDLAVPVTLASGIVPGIRVGDRVGILAGPGDTDAPPAVVVDGVRVLDVQAASSDADTTVVVVVTDRAGALRLALYAGRSEMLIADHLP